MHQRDNGSTEKDESLGIVVIVAIGIAVKMGPVKHIFPVDDIYRGDIFNRQFAHLKGQALRTQPCIQVGPDRFMTQTVFKHLSITRQNHANIHVQSPQGIGKTACDIGQSPGFGKGRSFRCDEDDAKRCHLLRLKCRRQAPDLVVELYKFNYFKRMYICLRLLSR